MIAFIFPNKQIPTGATRFDVPPGLVIWELMNNLHCAVASDEMTEWCNLNVRGECGACLAISHKFTGVRIWFADPTVALMFKMKWL